MLLSGPWGRCPPCAPSSSANIEALLLDPPTIALFLGPHHLWGLTVPQEGTGPCVGTLKLSTRLYYLLWHSSTRATIPSLCIRDATSPASLLSTWVPGFSRPPHLPMPQRQALWQYTCPWPFPCEPLGFPRSRLECPILSTRTQENWS